ncbi:MAG TPA: transcription-repair coupling factor, partial [Bacteroidetes bacterium]|nr:transcription-repair coupling factor [Bacteroidota bacterium]
RECLQIEYRGNVSLYVRLESLKKIQKYSGREGFTPPLTRIGHGDWEKIRKRARKAVSELAENLVKLYALRSSQKGYAFPPDDSLQREMEASFEFEETPDQLKAIMSVKEDMEEPKPMDRLVCGDVGYGKTEVALRAAYKAVLSGKQVGMLVPTTLLAQQHYANFIKRLASAAVEIEMLSRFRTQKQQKDILKRLKQGRIDIIIGTHRLLSKDVEFHNLGLLIVDEEHRFGVGHKEKIKSMKSLIDVLTLTATPIPRTLHMALIGARDMSLIHTAPQDRLPIETEIAPFSRDLITEAILREVDRGGQVYFVHNRIESIRAIKEMLERWLPQVRFTVAHGQMPERQLEKTMSEFLDKKYDCLVSTMIIESGLDLPNVNTMIVNRADRSGLAQLYQLRGRIGRSNRQAYAYLLTPPKLSVSDPARKRLEAIRYCSYLGAGFQLAMNDLEIRGAGEIFGAKQSGFIHAVGFDLYQKMLEESINELKQDANLSSRTNTSDRVDFEPKIEFPFDAFLPTDYVEKPEQRVELYRRLAAARDYDTLNNLLEETVDRYGAPPEQAGYL